MAPVTRDDFPLPDVNDPRVSEFFAGAARGELVIPRCDACGVWCWYPRARCAVCGAEGLSWTPVSGRGWLFSWAVVRRPFLAAFAAMVPFTTALVALDEEPAVRMVSYVVDAPPETLTAEMPLAVTFRPLSFPTLPDREVMVPMFTPSGNHP